MGKNQDPGSGINIPDPQHWQKHDNSAKLISSLKHFHASGNGPFLSNHYVFGGLDPFRSGTFF
jgi:hypothetical protein